MDTKTQQATVIEKGIRDLCNAVLSADEAFRNGDTERARSAISNAIPTVAEITLTMLLIMMRKDKHVPDLDADATEVTDEGSDVDGDTDTPDGNDLGIRPGRTLAPRPYR